MADPPKPQDAIKAAADALSEAIARELASRTILFHQAVAERMGLNVTDHRCLDIAMRASAEGPLTAGRLADLTGLTTGAITGVLDRLEKAGFVRREKDPNDRRQVLVRPLDERGAELAEIFEPLGRAMNEICSRYTAEELARFQNFFREMSDVLRRETERVRGGGAETSESSAPLGNIKTARLEFPQGLSHVILRATDEPLLYHAKFLGQGPKITAKNGHVSVEYSRSLFRMFSRSKDSTELFIHRHVPWDVVVRGGLWRLDVDLAGLVLSGIDITGGAADSTLTLPAPRGTVPITIRGGVHQVKLLRPANVPARLHISSGAHQLNIEAIQLGSVGGDMRWESPEFGAATDRYDIRVTGGAHKFTFGSPRSADTPSAPYR